jgi:hypothetical protein
LVTWTSCSVVLGSADPWLNRDVTTVVALETRPPRSLSRIDLAEARRMAIEFNERVNQAYARLAEAEAKVEATWEAEE